MNLPNQQITKQIGLVGAIFSSLIFAVPAVAQMNPRMPGNMNQMPGNEIPQMEGLSPAERSRLCAQYMNSTMREEQDFPGQNTDQPASITQTLPSGRVSEPPVVRDGRFATPSEAEMERICANQIMRRNRRGFNRGNSNNTMISQNYRYGQYRNRTIIPPTPEQRQAATTSVRTVNGLVNLRLVNNSGADIAYQVIGETQPRYLQGNNDINLRSVDTPTTLTFYRPDGGFLAVNPRPVSPGVLEVRFEPTSSFSLDKSALRIQPSGAVFLN
ncbi:hypothetical protein ACE1B6_19840 [Aerosakkonemataceae cyanobacterium BLCC-F154]|uniref:Uncharacterized protein n=1 Tax=Floridaenema fluviatile BLCC-F154 TaxID=3153640 RepID=A0ABV4YF95_9CYAN